MSTSAIDRLRRICAALPGAVEKASHGEPTWFAGEKGKVFAMLDHRHHGAARVSVYVPAPDGLQETLVGNEPERYWVPPYVGHRGWIGVFIDGDVDWQMVEELVREGYHRGITSSRHAASRASSAVRRRDVAASDGDFREALCWLMSVVRLRRHQFLLERVRIDEQQ
jgi:predicted DNA-binding protein (MmcQ/YjbR family)